MEATPPAPTPPAAPPPAQAAPKRSASAARQYVLLARAWTAIERGEAETALELVERHRAAEPDSVLAEEREALRVVALLRLRRLAEARAAAKEFVARYPNSIHRPLVDPALEKAP
jgi:outer membrane protein assembly factor BamD (BamD/ComL family)